MECHHKHGGHRSFIRKVGTALELDFMRGANVGKGSRAAAHRALVIGENPLGIAPAEGPSRQGAGRRKG